MPIPEETIQQILAATDIVELVESYFPLQKKGQDHWACCPFHSEKSPSFKVSSVRQGYYCFGCGAKGNAIGFIMEYESLDFPSTVKRLADRAGITIQEDKYDPNINKQVALRKKITQINHESSKWFHDYLLKSNSNEASNARNYLKERDIGIETAKSWKIGLAPANSQSFEEWSRDNGFTQDQMVASGLRSLKDQNDSSKGSYPRFKNRIMFPIYNDYGDAIAFSGRIFSANNKLAKYVNSPETIAFKKSQIFFGLHKSKRAIAKSESVIICEGQLDLIRCFESGIKNIVAPLGTALTEPHIKLLRRFTGEKGEVILCFDSDSAGYKAALRAYGELSQAGLFTRSIKLPPEYDPDKLILEKGAEEFKSLIIQAVSFHDFQIETLSKELNLNDSRDRVQFANELSHTISLIKDPIARDASINEVAIRIGISAEQFRKRVASYSKNKINPNEVEIDIEKSSNQIQVGPDVEILIKLALTDLDTIEWIKGFLNLDNELKDINDSDILIELFRSLPKSIRPEDVNAFISTKEPQLQTILNEIILKETMLLTLVDAKKALIRLKMKSLQNKIDLNKTFSLKEGLSNEEILTITSKVETQRKELLDFKKALTNINIRQR
ncbi:DNA primase [Verrucomicrobiales bacterium]|nr:DNA primase [Verrucomicrobiales bacterium]